ncbi:hypothetical protein BB934_21525 [Microvirga ossetica]|uniref:Uncharacterized protein n=1 Tax=Microvirga ossetica TaxID=1882682 RepID=A0A1B2EKN6_9HYPH|nr:hypothetical protein BB934_21525 [Microvirga ossetica]
MVQAILDRAHDAVDLALNGHALRFNLRSLATCFLGQPVHLLLVGAGELRHQLGREQVLLQRLEDARLDLVAADGAVVGAGALRAPPGATIPVLGHDGITSAAAATGQKA